MVERLHRQIKDALRARGASTEWESHLLWLLLGLRTAPKEESGISTSKATQGQQLVVPGQAHTMHVEGLSAANVPPAVIEVLCRGGSFPCVPPGLSELGECAAGRFWTAYGRQLPGAFPHAAD